MTAFFLLVFAPCLMAAPPAGAPTEASEEVIVWGDPFLRWDDTTWALDMSLTLIEPMVLDVGENHTLRVRDVKVAAVIHCNKDAKLGPKSYEISCSLDDVGVQLGSSNRASEVEIRNLDEMAQVLDGWLTDKELQLQVGARGTVPNIDLDGLITHNRAQNLTQEDLRLLLARIMAPFHVRWPDQLGPQLGREWIEYNSPIFAFPAPTGSPGSSTTAHRIDRLDDHWILQSIGKAMSSMQMSGQVMDSSSSGDGTTITAPVRSPRQLLNLWSTYDMAFSAVAIIDPNTGYITERIWSVTGEPTPSSPDALANKRYAYSGKLRLVDDGGRAERAKASDTRSSSPRGTPELGTSPERFTL